MQKFYTVFLLLGNITGGKLLFECLEGGWYNTILSIWLFQKRLCHSQLSILEPKGTLGTVITSDNAPVKVVTVLRCVW